MAKLILIFTIFCLAFTFPALAQEVPPTTSPTQVISSSGTPLNVGWNYFTVSAPECTLKNIFNELQAAGGGALLVQTIWKEENGGWKMFDINNSDNVKVNSDNVFAFNSNQKFYLNIAADACKTKNTNRDLQIQQVRDLSTGQKESSFLDKLLSVPGDFWNGLFGKMGINKQDSLLSNLKYPTETAVFNTLNVLGKTTVTDLGITGKITSGLLSINGLDNTVALGSVTINTISSDLYLQNLGVGGVNFLNGKVLIDKNGNLTVQNTLSAKKYNVDATDSTSSSIGSGIITAGTTSITITTSAVTDISKIFVTPVSDTDKPLIVKNKVTGKSFDVTILTPYSGDIHFDWFIVN